MEKAAHVCRWMLAKVIDDSVSDRGSTRQTGQRGVSGRGCRVQETTNNSSLSAVPLQRCDARVVAARQISASRCNSPRETYVSTARSFVRSLISQPESRALEPGVSNVCWIYVGVRVGVSKGKFVRTRKRARNAFSASQGS